MFINPTTALVCFLNLNFTTREGKLKKAVPVIGTAFCYILHQDGSNQNHFPIIIKLASLLQPETSTLPYPLFNILIGFLFLLFSSVDVYQITKLVPDCRSTDIQHIVDLAWIKSVP